MVLNEIKSLLYAIQKNPTATLIKITEKGYDIFLEKFIDILTKKLKDKLLLVASASGHLDIINLLLKNGAKVIKYDIIIAAAQNGRINILSHYTDLVSEDIKNRALATAASSAQINSVIYLVENGADINKYNALSIAAKMGHLDVVKFLVENDVDFYDDDEPLALWNAANGGYLDVVKYLAPYYNNLDKSSVLDGPGQNGYLDIVKFLIDDGADAHYHYDSLLDIAATNGHLAQADHRSDQLAALVQSTALRRYC